MARGFLFALSPPPPRTVKNTVSRSLALTAAAILVCLTLGAPARGQDMAGLFRAGMGARPRLPSGRACLRTSATSCLTRPSPLFRAMLFRRPALVRVRLELARAFFLKGEDRLARRHFEQVLAGTPPAPVALNVNRFLNIMRARKRWSLRLGAALLPDTNIGARSDERIIYIDFGSQRLPFRRNQEELTTSGIGVSAWLGGEYQYPLGDPGTGSGASRWRLRAGGNISRREYRTSEFDTMTVSGHVGPRWLIGRASEASLFLSGLHHWTGSGLEEPSHHDIGLRVEGRHRLIRRTTVNGQLSRHERRYDN